MRKRSSLLFGGICGIALLASEAQAQGDPRPPADRSAGVAEVVVTARRREEALQEVPVAVTAISSAQLEARTVKAIQDIAQIAPGLNIAQSTRGSANALIGLRGQETSGSSILNDPSVGLYFDEVYLGRSAGALIASVEDMASVQVLRGPQGTLFGRNNTGGAILLTPNRPNLDEFSGQLTVSAGSYNRFEWGGVLNVPIVEDKVAVRALYKRTRRDGIGESIVTGIDSFDNLNRENGRISLRFTPSEAVRFDLTYDWVDVDETGPNTVGLAPFPGLGFYQNRHGLLTPLSQAHVEGYTFRGEFDVSEDMTFKAIVGRRIQNTNLEGDVDTGPSTAQDIWNFLKQSQWSVELQLSGTTLRNTGLMKELSYTGGFFYFRESGFDGLSVGLPLARDFLRSSRYTNNFASNTSSAGYVQAESNHGDRLFLTAGLRYTKDERDVRITALGSGRCLLQALPTGTPPSVCFQSGDAAFDYWSYSAGARYQLTPDANLYVKYDKGHKSGGLDDTPTSILPFNPEVIKSIEVGAKADFFNRRLRTNIAAYHSKIAQVQRTSSLNDPNGAPYVSVFNAARARVRGVEVEAVLRPVTGLTFEGSLALTDAEYLEFRDPRAGPGFGQDLSHLNFPRTPETTYTLSASYDTELAEFGQLLLRVDYAYRSRLDFESYNDPRVVQKGYGILNARIQLDLENAPFGKGVSIAAFGRNLTDEEYSTWGTTGGGGLLVRSPDPRTYGAELKVSF